MVPVLCRAAFESTLTDRYRADRLAAGAAHRDVDDALRGANTLHQLAALTMFGSMSEGSKVLPQLDRMDHRFADAFQAMNKGTHAPYGGHLRGLVEDVRALIARPEVKP